MKINNLISKIEGVQTLKSVMIILGINMNQANYIIRKLKKEGYIKVKRLSDGSAIYNIAVENKFSGMSYYEILNSNSPIKIRPSVQVYVYSKVPSIEKTLIFAIKTKNLRTILASLALFKKIQFWPELYRRSKENHIEREVGALYDLAKTIMRVRRMPAGFRNRSLPKLEYSYVYVIDNLKSKDFKKIEQRWKVYLPFNKADLEEYA